MTNEEWNDKRLRAYDAAEPEFCKAVALLQTLEVLIDARFTMLNGLDVEALNMLSVQFEAGMEQLLKARRTLYLS